MFLNVGAVFMGTALTIRDLIGERAIFRREQAVGLSTTAYLLAKVGVYTVFALMQSAIMTAIVVWGKGAPTQGAVALGNPSLELFVTIAGTCVASASLGLLLSAVAKSNEQIMPLLVVAIMSQLVFSGGMVPVTDRAVLDQMSWLTPARWGFAASASTVDLIKLVPGPSRRKTVGGSTPHRVGGSTWPCWPFSAWATWRSCAGRSGSRAPDPFSRTLSTTTVRAKNTGMHPAVFFSL